MEKSCLGNRRYVLWGAVLGLLLPRLGGQAGSGQLGAKGCARSCGVVWGLCVVGFGFSSGCDALCFLREG